MRIILIVCITIICLGLSFFNEAIKSSLIGMNFSWSLSAGFLLGVILFLMIVLSILVMKEEKFSTIIKTIVIILSIGIVSTVYFIQNPIYQEDWSKVGQEVATGEYNNNSVLDSVRQVNESFDGLIAIYTPNCPHCKASMQKLSLMKQRSPETDIYISLYTKDKNIVKEFKEETEVFNLEVYSVEEEKGTLDLCNRSFPAFVYYKNNEVIHKWTNDDFGFRALDWVESGLE